MAQIKIFVKDILGKGLENVSVVFNLGHRGLIEKVTDKDGNISISGLEPGVIPVTISKEGFNTKSFVIELEDAEQVLYKEVVMIYIENKEIENMVIADVTKVIVDAYTFIEPNNIDEAKQWYKGLEKNIDEQKAIINKAIKDGVHDVVQQQASNLTYTLGQQLTASIHWYVNERSKLNPLRSLQDLSRWSSMTSMIGGLYFIRSNLVDFLNKILEKLEKGFRAEFYSALIFVLDKSSKMCYIRYRI